MDKIDQDARYHFNSIVDGGCVGIDDKDAEKEASWRALQDQMPKRPREDYNKERAHTTDKRTAAKSYVKGNNFKNESKYMNKKLIRLTESDLHRIVKESVKKILKEDGKPITKEQAGQMLMSYVDNNEFGDRFYEFAQDLCNRAIQDIESKYSIVDIDGVPYTDEDEEMWYDNYRDDFMRAVFEKIQTGQL